MANLSQDKPMIVDLCIQLFREKLSSKMCTRQTRKVIWDMINTLFRDTFAVKPTFVAFLLHSQTYLHYLSCHSFNFFGRRVNSKPPAIPFGIVACTFSDNLSRNSSIESATKQAGTLSSQRHFPPFPETVDTTCFKKRKIKPFHSYSLLLKLSVRNRKKSQL